MPLDEEEYADVVFMSCPFDSATICRSKDPESSPPPSVVIVVWTWFGSKSDSWPLK